MSGPGRFVSVRRDDRVAVVTLERPEALNAISGDLAEQLAAACRAVASDPEAWVVVLAAAGDRAFCVGADLKERNAFSDEDLRAQRPVFRAAFGGVLGLPMPVVAAVHGFALGGGFEFALSCDLIVCDETAVVGLPEVTVGVIPGGGGTQLLMRRVGMARASDLVFTGRRLEVAEAEALGLVDRRVPPGRDREEALELASVIAANSPVGVRNAKRALREGWGLDLAAGLAVEDAGWQATAFSGDRIEGVAAFNEKRRPDWPGE